MLCGRLFSQLALLALCAAFAAPALPAQDGQLDPSFNPIDNGLFGDGPNGPLQHVIVQPDGRALIFGGFNAYNGHARKKVARVEASGALDPSFDCGPVGSPLTYSFALQPDGKTLIGGQFQGFNGVPARSVVRLETSGAVDATFNSGLPPSNTVTAIAPQSDGKVLVGGMFDHGPNGAWGVRRLMPDGSIDATFFVGPNWGAYPRALAVQPDGRILVCGDFLSVNSVSRRYVARLNADGTLDASFDPGPGSNDSVTRLLLQPDGRVLISGYFTQVAGTARRHVARLNANGSLDTSFDPGAGPNSWVRTIALQPDGKVLLGGLFSSVAGQFARGVARLTASGSVDTVFDGVGIFSEEVATLALQADGKILIGGTFTDVAGVSQPYLTRFTASGVRDATYNSGAGADDSVLAIALRPDGSALVGGRLSRFNGALSSRLVGLDANGAVDTAFDPGAGVSGTVYAIAHQPDGKSLVAGDLWEYDGAPVRSIVRVNPDGSRDPSFNAGAGAYPSHPVAVALQSDGRVLVGGSFNSFDGQPRGAIARLLSDGSVDPTFTTPDGGANSVYALALLPSGKVLIAGAFTNYGATTRNRIAQLNADGSLDGTFNPHLGANNAVYAIAAQPDGKVVIGGAFTAYFGASRNSVARLLASGGLDASFDPGAGVTSSTTAWPEVRALALQPDGKLVLGGVFTHVDGVARRNLARLEANGDLDANFATPPGADDSVDALALEQHGRVWVGGNFTKLRGATRHRLGRVFAYEAPALSYCTAGTSSNGCAPSLSSSGSASVAASSGFVLVASDLEGQRQGLLFYGISGRRAAPWGAGSTSFACVESPVQRMDVANSGGSSGQCDGALSVDWRAWMAARPTALGQPLVAGQLVNAQAWYRDPAAPRGTNLSSASEFLLRP